MSHPIIKTFSNNLIIIGQYPPNTYELSLGLITSMSGYNKFKSLHTAEKNNINNGNKIYR